jgi:hypothetical protein
MKKLLTLLIVFSALTGFGQLALEHLKFDDEKYFYRKSANQKSFKYTVDIKVPSIEVISSDNDKGIEKFRSMKKHTNNFGTGKPLSIVAIPLLYEVEQSGNSTIFRFGRNAAEEDMNSAEVTVFQNNSPKSPSGTGRFISPPVKVNINSSEFYTYPNDGARNDEGFLMVDASRNQTATIKIDRETRRGRVFVCIFDKKGNLLKSLDPKSDTAQIFTVNEPVYVIPVISRTPVTGAPDNVKFEVGDPKEIAVVDIEEE